MHELIIQICFVVAGVVTGCTDGHIRTSDPYLTSQDVSPVYIYDAPRCVSNHYHTSHTPTLRVGPIRLSWPTYTSHHKAHPWCNSTRSHYHGNRWFPWKVKYKHRRGRKHHAHHGHHHKKSKVVIKQKRKPKVVTRHRNPTKVVIKPKTKKSKKYKAKKYNNKITVHRHGTSRVVIKPRQTPKRNWRQQPRPQVHIPKNLYKKDKKKKKNKKGNKKNKNDNRRF